jgi:maleate cis-trans isomerase
MAMWQRDGWAQTRIGILTPHAEVGPEAEFHAMASDGISIHAARVPANQVAFWKALALSGSPVRIEGYGQIFGLTPPRHKCDASLRSLAN